MRRAAHVVRLLVVVSATALPGCSTSDGWLAEWPHPLAAIATLGTLALALAFLTAKPAPFLRTRRGGLEGTDLEVNVSDRALALIGIVVLATLAAVLAAPKEASSEKEESPPSAKEQHEAAASSAARSPEATMAPAENPAPATPASKDGATQ